MEGIQALAELAVAGGYLGRHAIDLCPEHRIARHVLLVDVLERLPNLLREFKNERGLHRVRCRRGRLELQQPVPSLRQLLRVVVNAVEDAGRTLLLALHS